MFKEVIVEKIDVEEGTLIICRRYMALQTPDGVLHPADMDDYGIYLPIGARVWFVGLQGSYGRGEATENINLPFLLYRRLCLSKPETILSIKKNCSKLQLPMNVQ